MDEKADQGGVKVSDNFMVSMRQTLLRQRREIFERLRLFESDWQVLGEREIEMEEEAQKADLTRLFDQLANRRKHGLEEIDLALSKLARGSYGVCERCKKPISLKRLEVLPATRLCRKCAGRYEETQKS
jgi:RNA polymerase-binding transcription factor DksA